MSLWLRSNFDLEDLVQRLEERPRDSAQAIKLAERFYARHLSEGARRYYRLAAENGHDEHQTWRKLAESDVLVWQETNKEEDLEEALLALGRASDMLNTTMRQDPTPYMEIAALSYHLGHLKVMSRALTYVITGYPHTHYAGMAMHLAAQLLLLDGQLAQSREIYNRLLVEPPLYHVPPGTLIELLPAVPYDYSVILESALLYEKLHKDEYTNEGYAVIHRMLSVAEQDLKSGRRNLEALPPKHEPFGESEQALSLEGWLRSPAVWRVRQRDYAACRSWILAAFAAHKVATLLVYAYNGSPAAAAVDPREIAEAFMDEADFYTKLKRKEDASRCALEAMKWSPKDPLFCVRATEHLSCLPPSTLELTRSIASKSVQAATRIQCFIRRFLLYQSRGAMLIRYQRAAIKIQKTWRCWDTWNDNVALRIKAHGARRVHKLDKEYRNARPEARSLVKNAVHEAERAFTIILAVIHARTAFRRRMMIRKSVITIQRCFRGQRCRLALRLRFASCGRVSGCRRLIKGLRSKMCWQYEDEEVVSSSHDCDGTLHDEVGKIIVHISLRAPAQEAMRWMPLGLQTDERVSSTMNGAATLIVTSKCFNGWDARRSARIFSALAPPSICSLETLLLYGTSICGDGLKAVASFLTMEHCRITTLAIGDCRLGAKDKSFLGLRALGAGLTHPNCSLEKLCIQNDKTVGDDGAIVLLPYVQRNNTLRSLTLQALGLTGQCVRFVANTVLNCPDIHVFNLHGNRLDAPALERLLRTVFEHRTEEQQQTAGVELRLEGQKPPINVKALRQLGVDFVGAGNTVLFEIVEDASGAFSRVNLIGKHTLVGRPSSAQAQSVNSARRKVVRSSRAKTVCKKRISQTGQRVTAVCAFTAAPQASKRQSMGTIARRLFEPVAPAAHAPGHDEQSVDQVTSWTLERHPPARTSIKGARRPTARERLLYGRATRMTDVRHSRWTVSKGRDRDRAVGHASTVQDAAKVKRLKQRELMRQVLDVEEEQVLSVKTRVFL